MDTKRTVRLLSSIQGWHLLGSDKPDRGPSRGKGGILYTSALGGEKTLVASRQTEGDLTN